MNLVAKISQDENNKIIGRIGGNIPQYFLDKKESIIEYNFYAHFENPEKKEEYITVFTPKSYDSMIDGNIYPNCSIKIFTNAFSEESENKEYTIKHITKSYIVGYVEVNTDNFNFLTYSKSPNLIQDEDYYTEKLEEDKYNFFMQIDEDYYPEDILNGNYIFGYGALYLYKNFALNDIIAGFWQYS